MKKLGAEFESEEELNAAFTRFKDLSLAVRHITKSEVVPLHLSFLDNNHKN